jgi:hypothetical protein
VTAERQLNDRQRDRPETQVAQTLAELSGPSLLPLMPIGRRFSAPPDHPTARSQRFSLIQNLQRHQGNHFVQRLLQRDPAQQAQEPLDTAGLKIEEELDGAGLILQRETNPMAVTATVTLTTNSPTVQTRPGAAIGSAHGRPGAVGWTTPQYSIDVTPGSTVTRIGVTVTLNFMVELPSDYDAPRQAVVRDHEIGHIRIGERKAQEHLIDGLKRRLEGHTDGLTRAGVQGDIQAAATAFVDAEKTGSQGYDDADYARMVEAYRGTRASLAELGRTSSAISAMAQNMRRMATRIYSTMRSLDVAGVEQVAADFLSTKAALSTQELARLQYNQEFQGLVANCQTMLTSYLNGSGTLGMPFETMPDQMRASLETIKGNLGGFTFSPSGASAGF